MKKKVNDTIKTFKMFSAGDTVLVAVSGGADSVCLLYLVKRIALEYNLKLYIAHLNHGLRGREANRDENYCVLLGKKLGIPVIRKKIHLKSKTTSEDIARQARYSFLFEAANRVGANRIAMGHNADDQVETVLMRIIRGAGTKGLSGIPSIRQVNDNLSIVRPLISVWKKDIYKYLKKGKIDFVEDSTNKKPCFTRNKIRHELLPLMAKYNPNIKATLQTIGSNISLLDDFMQGYAEESLNGNISRIDKCVNVARKVIANAHPAVGQVIVRKIIQKYFPNIELDAKNTSRILLLAQERKGTSQVSIGQKLIVSRSYNKMTFSNMKDNEIVDFEKKIRIPGSSNIKIPSLDIKTSILEKKRHTQNVLKRDTNGLTLFNLDKKLCFEVEMDYDTICNPFLIRNVRKGDVFYPIGKGGKKKVQDIFVNNKISRNIRNKVPLIVSNGEICWIAGYRIGEKFKVTDKTKRVLKIKIKVD